jgi:hypothetical protein
MVLAESEQPGYDLGAIARRRGEACVLRGLREAPRGFLEAERGNESHIEVLQRQGHVRLGDGRLLLARD